MTKDGCEVITRFPADELLVTAGGKYTVAGPLPGERETTSNLNNPRLADAVVSVLEKIERVHHMGHLLRDRNEQAFHEHHDLVEALVAGDGERAEEITRTQIDSARRFAIDGLLASPSVQMVNVAAGRLRS